MLILVHNGDRRFRLPRDPRTLALASVEAVDNIAAPHAFWLSGTIPKSHL
jgi:hypothetical protein